MYISVSFASYMSDIVVLDFMSRIIEVLLEMEGWLEREHYLSYITNLAKQEKVLC